MAKIKFGGIDLDIQSSPKDESPVEQPADNFDKVMDQVRQMLEASKPTPAETPAPVVIQEKADLSPLIDRIERTEKAVMMDAMAISGQLDDMLKRLERAEAKAHPAPRLIEVPEVKQITHVKDVSAEVRLELLAHIEKNKTDIRLDINDMKTELKKSRTMNIVLGLVLTLTLLTQLI